MPVSDLFQILLTALHLTSVNAAFAGPILALWLDVRRTRHADAVADALGRRLLRVSLHGLYGGAFFGALSAFVWYNSHPAEVATAFRALPTSRYYFAVAELVFSAVCFELWLLLWRRGSRRALVGRFLAVAAITNTIYHFPTLFAVLSVLSTRPHEATSGISFLKHLGDGEVLARVAHFSAASLAVGGALLAALASLIGPKNIGSSTVAATPAEPIVVPPAAAFDVAARLKARGGLIALITTVLQWPIGIVVVLQLPEASREALMGHSMSATMLFVISLVAVVVLMHRLSAVAFGETTRAEVRSALFWLGITIFLMTGVRHYAREPLYLTNLDSHSVRHSTPFGDHAHGYRRS
jgi:hypothetical protein